MFMQAPELANNQGTQVMNQAYYCIGSWKGQRLAGSHSLFKSDNLF